MKVKELLEHSMSEVFTFKQACDLAHDIERSRGKVANQHTVRIAYDEAVKACKHHGVDPKTHLEQYFLKYYNDGYEPDHGFDGHLGMHDSLA